MDFLCGKMIEKKLLNQITELLSSEDRIIIDPPVDYREVIISKDKVYAIQNNKSAEIVSSTISEIIENKIFKALEPYSKQKTYVINIYIGDKASTLNISGTTSLDSFLNEVLFFLKAKVQEASASVLEEI